MDNKHTALARNSSVKNPAPTQSRFYKRLVRRRARREGCFINGRGFRHIKNLNDLSGVTYAFWLIRKQN